ncbi:MAG: hypothetical protein AB7T58_14670, partial [Hyphomonadaceae bacterium]
SSGARARLLLGGSGDLIWIDRTVRHILREGDGALLDLLARRWVDQSAQARQHVDRLDRDQGRDGAAVSVKSDHGIVDLGRLESFSKIRARL